MGAFLYSLFLQWILDIRSKAMLITGYVLPLIFFFFMGGIFTSVNPLSQETLIQSMCIFGISMGALVGLPPALVELYSSEIKKVYKANGIPLSLSVATHFISAFLHLLIMSSIIFILAPLLFEAELPKNITTFFISLTLFIMATLGIGCIFGLVMKNIAKLTMVSQIIFLPSIMLSGIMFPTDLLPKALNYVSKIFPATWAFQAMTEETVRLELCVPVLVVFLISCLVCIILLSKKVNL